MAEISYTELSATSMAIVSALVQETLKQKAILLPTISDYSSFAQKGASSVKVPRRTQFAAADKAENTDLTAQEITFAVDEILLSKKKAIYAKVELQPEYQSVVNVQAEVIQEMAAELALQVDKDIITQLLATSAAAPDHRIQYANTPTDTIQQTDILEARRLLNVQNCPLTDRYMVIHPTQEKAMLLLSDFVRADSYGSPNGLREAELGRIYGFTVLMHNSMTNPNSLFYHKSHVGYATQMQPQFDSDKELKSVSMQYLMHLLYGVLVLDSGKRGVLINATGA